MSKITGSVKWFNDAKGYGFIVSDSGDEVFVHHNDIAGEGFRYLRRGQRVTYDIVDEGNGPKAVNVIAEAQEETVPVLTSEGAVKTSKRKRYVLNQMLSLDEDREHEFKSLRNSKEPVKTITEYYVEKYVNAFLNTNGGVIYFGIHDNGKVLGLKLTRPQRDELRTEISRVIDEFQPSVEPDLYKLRFIEVASAEDTYVVEIHVAKGTASLYMTGSQHFFIRRDGSNFLMHFDMIRNRLQTPRSESRPSQVEESRSQIAQKIQQDERLKDTEQADLDLGILLAMVFMSWSDSELSQEEKELLETRARDQGLDEEDVNVLMKAAFEPPLLKTIDSYLPTHESKQAAATVAYMTALSDSVLTEEELAAFDKMCEALGLSVDERKEIRVIGDSSARQTGEDMSSE